MVNNNNSTAIETVTATLVAANHALANDTAAVADIHRIVNKFNVEGKRPFYIYCSTTGLKKGMSQTPVFEKRLAKADGDILNLFATYNAREGRKAIASVAPSNTPVTIDVEAEVVTEPKLLALPAPAVDIVEGLTEQVAPEAEQVTKAKRKRKAKAKVEAEVAPATEVTTNPWVTASN